MLLTIHLPVDGLEFLCNEPISSNDIFFAIITNETKKNCVFLKDALSILF